MKDRDRRLVKEFERALKAFSEDRHPLVGVEDGRRRSVLARQLVESVKRVRYTERLKERNISPRRADPRDPVFDPVSAAVYHLRESRTEEAFWCVFLFVHFGRHAAGGYRYAREVYGQLGEGPSWDWARVSADPDSFADWISVNEARIRLSDEAGGFGNHRKYESLKETGKVVQSYVDWVAPPRTHEELSSTAVAEAEGDPRRGFDRLYKSMASVYRFGRTARFDYLAMVGRLGLAEIEPGSAYLEGATGPYRGGLLLVGAEGGRTPSRRELDTRLIELGEHLGVGMQVVEDALCNWQKSPARFRSFRG